MIGQDSNPGPEPEDHMEKSWLVDWAMVLEAGVVSTEGWRPCRMRAAV